MLRPLARLAPILFAPLLAFGAATPAQAAPVILGLSTSIEIDWPLLTITATGTFDGGIVANNAVALQIAGVEWSDTATVRPLSGSPTSVRLANTNTIVWQWELHELWSNVHVDWTAEAAGLAPTPFFGSCAGTFSLVNGDIATYRSC